MIITGLYISYVMWFFVSLRFFLKKQKEAYEIAFLSIYLYIGHLLRVCLLIPIQFLLGWKGLKRITAFKSA